MSSSNCCFLTCIQVSEEAGQVVWYSHSKSLIATSHQGRVVTQIGDGACSRPSSLVGAAELGDESGHLPPGLRCHVVQAALTPIRGCACWSHAIKYRYDPRAVQPGVGWARVCLASSLD